MKKFLLSIFAVMLAVFSVQAEEIKYSFSNYETGVQYAQGEKHTLDENVTLIINGAHLNGQVRLYAGSNAVFESKRDITKVVLNAGNKAGTLTVNVSDDGSTWTKVKEQTTTTSYTAYTFDLGGSYKYVQMVSTGAQIRVSIATLTFSEDAGGEGGETPDVPELETLATPVISPESFEFNLGESVNVTISAVEGATIHYTLNGATPTELSAVYSSALSIEETTTVKAIAVKDGYNNSAVAEATYTAVDPNAKTAEIVAKDLGYENAADVEEIKIGDYITVTFKNGTSSNATKYYNTGNGIRNYNGNLITFTAAAGVTINSIVFTASSKDYKENPINLSSGTATIDGAVTTISNIAASTLSFTQSSNTSRIQKIEVTYSIEEGAVVIATPSITESTSFVGSTTVEITNNAEGTTLCYSTNGVDYVAYTEALNITETTTVYAKAVDAHGNESAVAEATYTKIEVLSIAEAKAAYDAVSANVDVAVDLTGAVVTVNNGQYLFIENETTGINIYNSGADYAEGTKFTAGYILGTSTTYRNMHQLSNVEFCGVETTAVTVKPLEVTIADIAGNYDEYEGRFVKLEGVSIASDLTMTQDGNDYKAYDRFALGFGAIANCDVTGVVAIYNTGEQLYIKDITYNLSVTAAGYATLFLDFNAAIPTNVEAYIIKEDGINNGYITLTQVTGVLPANTGVIVKATEDDYTFAYSKETPATVTGNLLEGTATATEINVEAYVLGNVDGVGLYKAKMTDGKWLNNAYKAYLPATAVPNKSVAFYGFDWDGTTGIEQITDNREQSTAIYDLTGRRIEAITAPGIYVVNGKKVLVK